MDLLRVFGEVQPLLTKGLWITVEVTVLSLLLALVIGLISCFLALSKRAPLRWISKIYVGQLKMECKDGQFLVYSGVMRGSVFNYDYVSSQDAQIKNSSSPLGPGWSLAEYVVNQRTIMGIFAPTATVPQEALEMMADFARDPRQFPFK